jgi:hypothetical protein
MGLAMSFPQLILILVIVVAIIYPYTRIFGKAGFSPWLGLLICVPLVNIIMIWYLALAEWPAQRR